MKKISVLLALAAGSVYASADSLVFDAMSGTPAPTFTGTSSTPHTLMGTAVKLGNVGSGPVHISGLDIAFRAYTAATYTNIRLDIMFFGSASLATTGTTTAFSNLLYTRVIETGAKTVAANTRYTYSSATPSTAPGVTLNPGFNVADPSKALGILVLIRGDKNDGKGLVATDDLGISLRTGPAPVIGSIAVGTGDAGGYYRNASNATPTATTMLIGSDYRSITGATYAGLTMRLYAQAVPEPGTFAVLGLGAVAFLRRRRK